MIILRMNKHCGNFVPRAYNAQGKTYTIVMKKLSLKLYFSSLSHSLLGKVLTLQHH